MSSIDDLIKRVEKFENKINEYIRLEIIEDEPYICNMNTDKQLFREGITRDGVKIDSYAPYTLTTKRIKSAKGQPTDRVTLRDTGDFYSAFFIMADDKGFKIESEDWKVDKLVDKYGEEILGLTDDNLNELIWEYIYPMLIEKARQI